MTMHDGVNMLNDQDSISLTVLVRRLLAAPKDSAGRVRLYPNMRQAILSAHGALRYAEREIQASRKAASRGEISREAADYRVAYSVERVTAEMTEQAAKTEKALLRSRAGAEKLRKKQAALRRENAALRRALGLAPRRDDISRDVVEPPAEGRHDLGTAEGEEGGGPSNL
jgi:hypothetical protein